MATLPGLSYQHSSAETVGAHEEAGPDKALNSSSWRGTNISGAASIGAQRQARSRSTHETLGLSLSFTLVAGLREKECCSPNCAHIALAAGFRWLTTKAAAAAAAQPRFAGHGALHMIQGSPSQPALQHHTPYVYPFSHVTLVFLACPLPPGGLSVRQQQVVGNLQRIRAVVKHQVAKADETRTGQFLAASAKGEADRIKLLLQQGYNPNTCDYDKRTALMLAAANGHKVGPGCMLPPRGEGGQEKGLKGGKEMEGGRNTGWASAEFTCQ